MARRKWIDKKSAAHFTLVHRPQNDPRIHDESAPSMVLNPTQLGNAGGTHKSKHLDDLASQLGSEAEDIRANEGEAANYGIYFDDSEYDYMQHLRDIGDGGGEATFIEATPPLNKGKGKHKKSLADAIREQDMQNQSEELLDDDILPSKNLTRVTYQNQQDVPDAISGLQPNMDPRLREVLEALDDDAFVDDEDDEIFKELAKDGHEIDEYEFEETYPGDLGDDDGWESDATEKPAEAHTDRAPVQEDDDLEIPPDLVDMLTTGDDASVDGDLHQPASHPAVPLTRAPRARTELQKVMGARDHARFEKVRKDFSAGGEEYSAPTVQAPRPDFDKIMDEFLAGYSMRGKRVVKGAAQSGIDQLDEIRRELGPARIPKKYRKKTEKK